MRAERGMITVFATACMETRHVHHRVESEAVQPG